MAVAHVQEAMKGENEKQAVASEKESPVTPTQDKRSWRIEDEQEIPKNNLPLVFFSLLLATFLVRPRTSSLELHI